MNRCGAHLADRCLVSSSVLGGVLTAPPDPPSHPYTGLDRCAGLCVCAQVCVCVCVMCVCVWGVAWGTERARL